MNTANSIKKYIPAASHDWLLPFYDPFVKLLGAEGARKKLLDRAAIQPGFRILDIGCGTGSFAILIKRLHPAVDVSDSILTERRSSERKEKRNTIRYQSG